MKKVLIVGVKKMLGQELEKVFSDDEMYKVISWSEAEIDITNEKDIREKILKLRPEIILNTMEYSKIDKCEKDEREYAQALILNKQVPEYLARVAKEIGAIFVHYSTEYVFGGEMPKITEPEGCTGSCGSCSLHNDFEPKIGFRENDLPSPVNKYGESKLSGEEKIQEIDGNYYIIRTARLFGKSIQEKEIDKNFFSEMLAKGKKMTEEVKAVDEETGNFTYVSDLAQKTKEIVEAKKEFGIYHIANSGYYTWFDAVEILYELAGIKKKIIPIASAELSRLAKRPYFSVLLNTKLNPLRSYEEALAEYLKRS